MKTNGLDFLKVKDGFSVRKNRGIAIMQGPATTMPAKRIAKNCLIVNSATAVAVAMATHGVSPATNGGDCFNR